MNTNEAMKFFFTKIKSYLVKNCIIAFNEPYNFPCWEEGEYKALK